MATFNLNIKTTPPSVTPHTIYRSNLHKKIQENINEKLILISTGAGWGMRTLFFLIFLSLLILLFGCKWENNSSSGPPNNLPVADDGDKKLIKTKSSVDHNGSGSSDEDGDKLTYN
jgi:hypothetical protein